MALIDLGDVAEATRPPEVPLDHRRLARIALAVLTVAGSLVLAGSARPGGQGLRPLWTASLADGDTFTLDGDTAYLHRMSGGQAVLSAYELATGTVRWTIPTGTSIAGYGTTRAGGVLLVSSDPARITKSDPSGGYVYYTEFSRATMALDPRTGARLWRTDGEISPDDITGDTALVSERDDDGKPTRVRLVRLPDGRQLWSRPVPGADAIAVTSDEVVTVTRKGLATIYAHRDGSLSRSGQLRLPAVKTQAALPTGLSPAGRYFSVVQFGDEANISTVYRAGDLRPLWNADSSRGFIQACGPMLCTFGTNEVAGHDPDSGWVRWREPGMAGIRPLTPDRLMVDNIITSGIEPSLVLIDPGTGQRIGAPIRGLPVASTRPYPWILLLRPATEAGQVAVIRLDVTTGRTAPLGVTESPVDRACESSGRYLLCPHDGRLAVTAIG